jgi:hypothetical protein
MAQRRGTAIKQGAVTDVMSHLSELPEREKDPGETVSLGEIFRTKAYLNEIKGALKKGYTFENLAAIFAERCGVAVSARQIKYHFTHAKNQSAKGKLGKKAEEDSAHEGSVSSTDSPGESTAEGVKENFIAPDPPTKASSNVSGFSFEGRTPARAEGDVDHGAFPANVRPEES